MGRRRVFWHADQVDFADRALLFLQKPSFHAIHSQNVPALRHPNHHLAICELPLAQLAFIVVMRSLFIGKLLQKPEISLDNGGWVGLGQVLFIGESSIKSPPRRSVLLDENNDYPDQHYCPNAKKGPSEGEKDAALDEVFIFEDERLLVLSRLLLV